MSFIDASYFVGDLQIPNTDQQSVAQRLAWFINKYEPQFLERLFGYPLYKAFVDSVTVAPPAVPASRFLDILYGKEYTDFQGRPRKWKGLIVTDNPVFTSGGLAYRKTEYITAGVTAGFPAGVSSIVVPDWIGWTPIITRTGIMKPDVDYSWDKDTGTWTLLSPGDKFGNRENFAVQFEQRTDGTTPSIDLSGSNISCIANYVYLQIRRNSSTNTTDFGETVATADNTRNASPRKKASFIWNEMHRWVTDFTHFMRGIQDADATIYPEWTTIDEMNALRTFGFMNPIY